MSIERHSSALPRRDAPPSADEIFGEREFSEIELGLLQMQILWLLSRKSTHGYELMKMLNNIKKTKITQGTLYPTLQTLEGRGLIKRHDVDRRFVYSITLKGRKVMNETCMDFSRTFFGIFQNFVCEKCVGYEHKKGEFVKIGSVKK